MNILEHALKHAAKGLLVFPCHSIVDGQCTCGKSDCKKPGKHPAISKWGAAATTDPEAIRRWNWVDRNIGATFPDDVFVLDTDVKGDGPLNLAWLEHIHGTLPRTLTVETGSGGQHRYFRSKEKIPQSVGCIHCGIDTRVSGKGYVIVPPSIHASGRRYRVEIDAPIAEASEWLVRLAKLSKKAVAEPEWSTMADGSGRNEAIHKWLSSMRARGASDQEIRSLAESRNGMMAEPLDTKELENTVLRSVLGYEQGDQFKRNQYKKIINSCYSNIKEAVSTAKIGLRHNSLLQSTEVRHDIFGSGWIPYNDDIRDDVQDYFDRRWEGFHPPDNLTDKAIGVMGRKNSYHPILDYLKEFKWDGKERLDTWVIRYLGADDTDLNRAIGRTFLIAAVRRMRKPGTKYDCMPIFEGPQGCGKSSALRILALRDQWFTDQSIFGLEGKQLIETIRGKWIVEESELHTMRKSEVEKVKGLLSRTHTRARMSYERNEREFAHSFVIAGTTNEDTYLKDLSGNRRFLCMTVGQILLDDLKDVVHQLWAEAAVAEDRGDDHYLPETLWKAQADAADQRMERHPWEDRLPPILDGLEGRIARDTLIVALGAPIERWNSLHDRIVALIMKRAGWEKRRIRVPGSGGVRGWFWTKGDWNSREILPQDLPYEKLA